MSGIEYIKPTHYLTIHEKQHATLCIINNQCMRCSSKQCLLEPCLICHKMCLTCQSCRQFGRSCSCCSLVNSEQRVKNINNIHCQWKGTLSIQQLEGSKKIRSAIQNNQNLLICAVTGSGKTEMLFSGIEYALNQNKRLCVAAPRIDVILELEPRLKQAFPSANIVTVYGQQSKNYVGSQFVLCTTHQLMKFKHTFSVLILDEIDSYPLHNNRMLLSRIPLTLTKKYSIIYMSATPPKHLLKLVNNKQLDSFQLPARYHQHALPVPQYYWIGNWQKDILNNKLSKRLHNLLQSQINTQRRFLIFLPNIKLMQKFENLLQNRYGNKFCFTSVYAEDSQRVEKIKMMRELKYDFLLTTTILERGVTFPNIDVLVIGSEHRIFTQSTLVQIAGRVGRHKDFPIGSVIFAHFGKTVDSNNAIKFIKEQNKKAKEFGYIQ